MSTTLKIVIKNAERKSLIEEYVIDPMADKDITMDKSDETINKYLNLLLDQFKGEPEHVIITAKMVLK